MALPDNLPAWARIGIQWAILGGAAVYAYFDVRSDIGQFKQFAANMDANLTSINQRISHLDVTDDRIDRMQKDIEVLQQWQRAVLLRERGPQ